MEGASQSNARLLLLFCIAAGQGRSVNEGEGFRDKDICRDILQVVSVLSNSLEVVQVC